MMSKKLPGDSSLTAHETAQLHHVITGVREKLSKICHTLSGTDVPVEPGKLIQDLEFQIRSLKYAQNYVRSHRDSDL